jgi:hypothetical protein
VELLLNRREILSHCQEKVAEYDAAALRRRSAPRSEPAAPPVVATAPAPAAAPLGPPAGFRLAAPSGVLPVAGSALVGQAVLYRHGHGDRWPVEGPGWVRGTVTSRSHAAGFSHVVRYGSTSSAVR